MEPRFLLMRGWRCIACFDGEGGGGSSGGGSGNAGADPKKSDKPDGEGGGDGDGKGSGADQTIPKARFDEVNTKLKDANKKLGELEAAQQAKAAEDAAKAEEDAAKKGEFEKLASERKISVDKLSIENKALTKQVQDLHAIVLKQQNDVTADWPEEVKNTDPAKDVEDGKVDLSARQTWIDNMAPLVERLNGNGSTNKGAGGTPRSPRPAGQRQGADLVKDNVEKLRSSGLYSRM